ncbi:hypothetical protein OB236_09670 [Paenibacillus sp. WQ 127069]|uniref:HEPN AbiU2-like domain-containing protein n=1 Tax=Paenibacillus baimaensis TaxID=2982185 RepID=A0ABT2UE36_9BACL|nr:hypothetical protein [Paenibacillus sp. WQ 127069]
MSYKELWSFDHNLTKYNSFFEKTINAHYLQAINCWCMVFGVASSNPTHWKKVLHNHEDFNSITLNAGLKEDKWQEYWNDVTSFRNRFSVHRELNFDEPVPSLAKAYDIALYYDEWVREYIRPDVIDDLLLRDIVEKYREDLHKLMDQLKVVLVTEGKN